MRILHVTPTYLPATRYGGPIYSVHGLCRALAKLGHDVHVFTTNVNGADDSQVTLGWPQDLEGVKVTYFPSKVLRRIYYSPKMKKKLSERIPSFDIVHNHSVFLWPTWASASEARRLHVPYVVSPRGMLVEELIRRKSTLAKSLWIRFIEKNNLRNAAAIHLTSAKEKAELQRLNLKLPKLFVVPNGVDVPREVPGTGISAAVRQAIAGGPYVLFLGRIYWKKGLDRLVQAIQKVPGRMRLVVAGNDEDGFRAKVEKQVRQLGLGERVVFVGPAYGTDKAALFKNARCFALPSYSENFGIAVVEAMLCGCPVIVTPGVGLSNFVRDMSCGIVSDGTPEDLARAIREIDGNEEDLCRMGLNARRAAAEAFEWESVAQAMLAVYSDVREAYKHSGGKR